MAVTVGWQLIATIAVSLLAWLVGGNLFGLSAVLGGLVVLVPNALFALHLARVTTKEAFPGAFLIGLGVKFVLTIAILFAIVRWDVAFSWPMLIGAMLLVLKAPMLGWFHARREAQQAVPQIGVANSARESTL